MLLKNGQNNFYFKNLEEIQKTWKKYSKNALQPKLSFVYIKIIIFFSGTYIRVTNCSLLYNSKDTANVIIHDTSPICKVSIIQEQHQKDNINK